MTSEWPHTYLHVVPYTRPARRCTAQKVTQYASGRLCIWPTDRGVGLNSRTVNKIHCIYMVPTTDTKCKSSLQCDVNVFLISDHRMRPVALALGPIWKPEGHRKTVHHIWTFPTQYFRVRHYSRTACIPVNNRRCWSHEFGIWPLKSAVCVMQQYFETN